MPTQAGIPLNNTPQPMWPAGELNPWDWIDEGNPVGWHTAAFMRGHPVAMSPWQQRQGEVVPTTGLGAPWYAHTRPFTRGAGAYAPQFGQLAYNPIGAGVYAPYKLPVIAGPGGDYEFGAIFFDVQVTPTSIRMNPTVPIESIDALLAQSYVGGMIVTEG